MFHKPLPPPPLPVKPVIEAPPIPKHRPPSTSSSSVPVAAAVKLFEKASPSITAQNAQHAYKVAAPHINKKNAVTAYNVYSAVQKNNQQMNVHRSPPPLPNKPAKPTVPVQNHTEPRTNYAVSLKHKFESPPELSSGGHHSSSGAFHTDPGPAPSSISVRNLKSQLESKLTLVPPGAIRPQPHPTSPTRPAPPPPQSWGAPPPPPPKIPHSYSTNAICETPVLMRPKTDNYNHDQERGKTEENRKSLPPARPPPPKIGSRNTSPTPNEPYAVAVYEFRGQKEDELSVQVGDEIVLKRDVDHEWIYGYCNRTAKYGIIPKSFVRIERPLPGSPTETARGQHREAVSSPTTSCDDDSGIGNTIDDGPRCYTLYEYNSSEPGDLCFNSGEMIRLTGRHTDEWLYGETVEGRTGNFPANFVQIIQDLPTQTYHEPYTPTSVPQTSHSKVAALYDYSSNETGDLNFRAGDMVELLSEVNPEWLRGRCHGQEGIFPSNFVDAQHVQLQKETQDAHADSQNQGGDSLIGRVVVAQYEYASMDQRDLYLFVGDRVQVTGQPSADWLQGRKVEGMSATRMPQGMFPAAFVTPE